MISHDVISYGAICNAIFVYKSDQYNEHLAKCANVIHVCVHASTALCQFNNLVTPLLSKHAVC